jgi:hypothetical protein
VLDAGREGGKLWDMPRSMRVEYQGAIYHVMDRGDRREDISVDGVDRLDLLKTLAEARRLQAADEEVFKPLRRGWCLGREEFRQKMLELMEGKLGENNAGGLPRERAEQRAKRILAEELARRGCAEADWAARRRSDPGKLAIAARLSSERTLPVKGIAARVQIGTTQGAKSLLHQLAQGQPRQKSARANSAYAQLEFQCMTPLLGPEMVKFSNPSTQLEIL